MEVFADGLPGVPDGITRSAEGTFWVGLVKPPVAAMPYLANRCAARAHAQSAAVRCG